MRKIVLAIAFFYAAGFTLQAQTSTKKNDIQLTSVIASEFLVFELTSNQASSKDYKVKIYNSEHKELKSEMLLVKKSDTEIKVNIADLPIGKYSCTVTRGNIELLSESFVKDAVDPL